MQNFAAEWIDHTDSAIEYGTHDRVVHAATFDQLADEDALINEGNMEVTRDEATVVVLHLAGVGDDTLYTLRFEVIREQYELAETGYLAPVKNGDARSFFAVAPLLVGVHQGMEHAMACWQRTNFVVAQELAHHGQAVGHVRERVIVGRACWRIGVVFRQAKATALRDEKCVYARGRAGITKTGRVPHQFLFPIKQAELGAKTLICQSGLLGLVEGAQQQIDTRLEKTILFRCHEAGPQY